MAIDREGTNQRSVALDAGMSDAWMSRICAGTVNPSPEHRKRIARILRSREQELF